MIYSSAQIATLSQSTNYRSFLKCAFGFLKKSSSGFTYADFSRRAGLASRSFPRDVVIGHKRLTSSSALAFAEALRIKGDLKQLFLLLIEVEGDGNASTLLLQKKSKAPTRANKKATAC